ncbi:6234_t:CDS:1, partial [Cetraspora pellucida]
DLNIKKFFEQVLVELIIINNLNTDGDVISKQYQMEEITLLNLEKIKNNLKLNNNKCIENYLKNNINLLIKDNIHDFDNDIKKEIDNIKQILKNFDNNN